MKRMTFSAFNPVRAAVPQGPRMLGDESQSEGTFLGFPGDKTIPMMDLNMSEHTA